MAVRDHLNRTPKLRAKVTTVDPSQGIIEVVTVDGAARRLATFDGPAFFRWPKVGEEWTIYEENGHWVLGGRYTLADEVLKAQQIQPGDALISADRIFLTSGATLTRKFVSEFHDAGTSIVILASSHGIEAPLTVQIQDIASGDILASVATINVDPVTSDVSVHFPWWIAADTVRVIVIG